MRVVVTSGPVVVFPVTAVVSVTTTPVVVGPCVAVGAETDAIVSCCRITVLLDRNSV